MFFLWICFCKKTIAGSSFMCFPIFSVRPSHLLDVRFRMPAAKASVPWASAGASGPCARLPRKVRCNFDWTFSRNSPRFLKEKVFSDGEILVCCPVQNTTFC